jgi:uncharacterized repeat protein (TIGR01451 family)
MRIRGLAGLAALGFALMLGGCGGGSGRSGTDLSVHGTGPTTQLNGGDQAVFVMTVANVGDFEATDLTIRNTTTQISQSSITITCTASGGATCPSVFGSTMTVPSMPGGGSLAFQIAGLTSLGASGTFSDTMTVSSGSLDNNGNNNTATVTSTVVSNDVGVTASAPAGPLLPGPATFSMVITNAGPDPALNVILTTTVSDNLKPFSSSVIKCVATNAPDGSAPSLPVLQSNGALVSATIPASASLACSIPVTVSDTSTGAASVSMTASTAGDSHSSNNTGTASVNPNLNNDLSVTASAGPASLAGGASATLSYVISNAGPAAGVDVTIANVLTAGLKLSSAIACTPTGGATAPVLQTDGSLLAASIPASATLTCKVPVTAVAGTNGTESSTFTVTSANDPAGGNNSAKVSIPVVSSDLGVTQTTGATQVNAGSPATFTAVIANPSGQGVANNVTVTWSHTAPAGVTFSAPTCTFSGGAACPAAVGSTLTVPSLPTASRLTLTFTATTTSTVRGAIANTVTVTGDGDPNTANNSASTSTTVVDPRSGSYTVFGSDGAQYTMSVDFDALSYTIAGGGASKTHAFTLDSASGDYVASGAIRFRAGQDVIVGGHDFTSTGTLPYIAVRSFITSVDNLRNTSYDLSTRVIAGGAATTHGGTAQYSGNIFSVCQSDTFPVVAVNDCDPGDRVDYETLTVSGNIFTATASNGDTYSFSVANIGAVKVLLSAGAVGSGTQFRVGPIDTSWVALGPVRGASVSPTGAGEWASITLATGPSLYSKTPVVGGSADSAGLTTLTSASINSMLTGSSSLYSAPIYVTQASPLVVVIGSSAGAASGLLQIALP